MGNIRRPGTDGRPRLRALDGGKDGAPNLPGREVEHGPADAARAARRKLARLLRAMQAAGRSIATVPDDVVTRLAHLDALTARHLHRPDVSEPEDIREACTAMLSIGAWLEDSLSRAELSRVRAYQLRIRIEEDELAHPLVRPDQVPEMHVPDGPAPHTLGLGLSGLAEPELVRVARRLGLRTPSQPGRGSLERRVLKTLRDDHLLGILVATLPDAALAILARLVRGRLSPVLSRSLARRESLAVAAGAEGLEVAADSAEPLRDCGLVFAAADPGAEHLWVPVELQHRLDGVLRAFGL